jgi:hypothetical protein
MRALMRAQDLKLALSYGQGFRLAARKFHGEDVLIEGLWLPLPSYNTSPPQWLTERLKAHAALTAADGTPLSIGYRGRDTYSGLNDLRQANNPLNLFNPDVSKPFARFIWQLIARVKASGVPIIAVQLGDNDVMPYYAGPSARLPIVTSHTFPGDGRSVIVLWRAYYRRQPKGDEETQGRVLAEERAEAQLFIGASGNEGLNKGVDHLIKLIRQRTW